MRKLIFQMAVSLDGFFEGPDKEIDWHNVDEEFNGYAIDMLNSVDTILFGRKTYELMASYWPSKQAIENDPIVAERMNGHKKLIFSRTLDKVGWNNMRLVKEVIPEDIISLKQQPGKDIVLGGSDLAVSFIEHGLIDEFRIIVVPVVLGGGKQLFEGLGHRLNMKLVRSKVFGSGNVLLYYVPVHA